MDNLIDISSIPETTYAHRNRARFLLEEVRRHQEKLGRPVDVLDVGCGTGDMITRWIAMLGAASVLGIDVHEPSIAWANAHHALPNLQFQVAVADDLLAGGQTFDIIVCSEILEHLYEPLPLLVTLRRLIRPDGLLLVTIPNGWGPKENEERLAKAFRKSVVYHWLKRRRDSQAVPPTSAEDLDMSDTLNFACGHVQFYTMTAITQLARQAGFAMGKQKNRRFLSGPITDRLFGKSERFIAWNVRVADRIPAWLASSWMFVFHPAPPQGSR